jgi:hypothetical protein
MKFPFDTATEWQNFCRNPNDWISEQRVTTRVVLSAEEQIAHENHEKLSQLTFVSHIQRQILTDAQHLEIRTWLRETSLQSGFFTQTGYRGMHAGHLVFKVFESWIEEPGFLQDLFNRGLDVAKPDMRGIAPGMLMLESLQKLGNDEKFNTNSVPGALPLSPTWKECFDLVLDAGGTAAFGEQLDGDSVAMILVDNIQSALDCPNLDLGSLSSGLLRARLDEHSPAAAAAPIQKKRL